MFLRQLVLLVSGSLFLGVISGLTSIHVSDLFSDTTYSYEWELMNHPIDFQGEIKQENKPILHLSQVSNSAGAPQNSASNTFAVDPRILS